MRSLSYECRQESLGQLYYESRDRDEAHLVSQQRCTNYITESWLLLDESGSK